MGGKTKSLLLLQPACFFFSQNPRKVAVSGNPRYRLRKELDVGRVRRWVVPFEIPSLGTAVVDCSLLGKKHCVGWGGVCCCTRQEGQYIDKIRPHEQHSFCFVFVICLSLGKKRRIAHENLALLGRGVVDPRPIL